jgi:hypothetical protein
VLAERNQQAPATRLASNGVRRPGS